MPDTSHPPSSEASERPLDEELAARRVQAETFLNFAQLSRTVDRLVGELFEHEGLSDVTPAQGGALMILFQERAPMTARQLAERMGLSQVTVGRFVKALHAGGWISRDADPSDARAILLRPTRKAMRALPRFIRVSNRLFDHAFEGLSEATIRRIFATTVRLRKNLQAELL